jgi:hypothetical protein
MKKLNLTDFRNQIETKDVKGNKTYLFINTDICRYAQSYQNTVNTIKNMKDSFTCFYYPMYEEDFLNNQEEAEPMTEQQARNELTCPNCGEEKQKGLVVCWNCFKYTENNYKNSGLSFEEWISQQKGE